MATWFIWGFVVLGLLICVSPFLMAFFPFLFGIDTSDPSWAAVLPFMLFLTVPFGLGVSAVGPLLVFLVEFIISKMW